MAATFSFGTLDGKPSAASDRAPVIVMAGKIVPGDLEKLISFSKTDSIFLSRTILLASEGGDAPEAIRIGRFVKDTFLSVAVNRRFRKCSSACFLIYVSAAERSAMPGGVGIHRPYFSNEYFAGLSPQEAETKYQVLSSRMRAFLVEMEVPADLIDRMFGLASTEIYWLTEDDVLRLGERAHWWDQYLVARCNADKDLEHRAATSEMLDPQFQKGFEAYTLRLAFCRDEALGQQAQRALIEYQAGTKKLPTRP
jgi:hypothetical protein